MTTLDEWEAGAKLIYQTPAEFKAKKVIDVLEVNESAWAKRCIALIDLVRKKDEALKKADRFMRDGWDGKVRSWKYRPGWDEAKNAIDEALALTEQLK